ncbi:MBOAT family protein [Nibrella saemangeumensis]|uniref:MBOAT family protein n=1 Tax=Nibrella saemangeumensis TaxID=1084526 RepID=A0ABP8NSE8_9BACT
MLYNSFEFIRLLLITFCLYYFPGVGRWQVPLLIIASLLFYAYGQADLLWLLLLSVLINILTSYFVVFGRQSLRKTIAICGVVGNLSILCFYKYGPLLGETFFPSGTALGEWLVSLPLPIGISFFTFQGISLIVDTYRNREVNEYRTLIARSLIKHARTVLLFKAFFPQLIAGPIVKAHFFLPQISPKLLKDVQWEYCFRTLVLGYFLKMVVADNLKDYTVLMTYPYFETVSSFTLIALLFGYSMQIFADFAGYSLIALGLAALFGYRFPINFNFPYMATSFSDFWRRWHISLSSFLREYLYIPLGGNRRGPVRTYINLLLTMVLGGLWHGAAWSYAVWGLAHGLALAGERLVRDYIRLPRASWLQAVKVVLVFGYVTFAWLLFRLPDFDHVLAYGRSLFMNSRKPHEVLSVGFIAVYSIPVLAYHWFYLLRKQGANQQALSAQWPHLDVAINSFMLFMIITNSGSSSTFIYFQF